MSFSAQLTGAVASIENLTTETMQKSYLQAFREVVTGTPEDTGQAMGGWHIVDGSTNGGNDSSSMSAQSAISEITSGVNQLALGDTALVYNNQPYIERLETGYSQQAPEGMVQKTVDRWPQIVRDNE
jgi:hypothetical protein